MNIQSVRAEPVEALLFVLSDGKSEGQPFDRLRANGVFLVVSEAIREAALRLQDTSPTARLDAEVLMAHCLGATRSELLLRRMREAVPEGFGPLVERRAAREPVAYIVGEQEFYGRRFLVAPGALIPRGDSETLIEAALGVKPAPERVLDLGTGSGALLLTLLAETGAQGVGVDASDAALEVARSNVELLALSDRAALMKRDWTQPDWREGLGRFDLIVCNPPYVETGAPLDRDVADYEPASALFAGADGLEDYALLLPQVNDLLCDNGVAVFEIGATQAQAVGELAEKAGFAAALRKDLANRPRALILS